LTRHFTPLFCLANESNTRIEIGLIACTEIPGGVGELRAALVERATANAVFAATEKHARKLPLAAAAIATAWQPIWQGKK